MAVGQATSKRFPHIPDAFLRLSTVQAHRKALVKCSECSREVPAGETETDNVLCPACYEDAGFENEHMDGDHRQEFEPACPECQKEAAKKALLADEANRAAAGPPWPLAAFSQESRAWLAMLLHHEAEEVARQYGGVLPRWPNEVLASYRQSARERVELIAQIESVLRQVPVDQVKLDLR